MANTGRESASIASERNSSKGLHNLKVGIKEMTQCERERDRRRETERERERERVRRKRQTGKQTHRNTVHQR